MWSRCSVRCRHRTMGQRNGDSPNACAMLTDADIEKEIAAGTIVRTHILRPTWHFVAAADIHWMLALSAPRVHAFNAYYYRIHELDQAVFKKSTKVLIKALEGGKQLTRAELGSALDKAGISMKDSSRLNASMMRAELDGVVCSGPRRGKQFTYVLLDECVARTKVLERDEALAELARRYFLTRGPATADDFSWWSGLTKSDSRRAAEAAAPDLEHEVIDGRSHWFPPPDPSDEAANATRAPAPQLRRILHRLKGSQCLRGASAGCENRGENRCPFGSHPGDQRADRRRLEPDSAGEGSGSPFEAAAAVDRSREARGREGSHELWRVSRYRGEDPIATRRRESPGSSDRCRD